MPSIKHYTSRWEFIVNKCKGRKVMHLGCIGNTEGSTSKKIQTMMEGRALHAQLRKICYSLVGIDHDIPTINALAEHGFTDIVYGDVCVLEESKLPGTFDIVLCGDLIEHLDKPGMMLECIKYFMNERSELLITTPNAFGLLQFIRYICNIFHEGNDHVMSFSIFTLQNMLHRYGFSIKEAYTCYNHPASTWQERLRYSLGVPFFRLFPKFGGTLLVIASLK